MWVNIKSMKQIALMREVCAGLACSALIRNAGQKNGFPASKPAQQTLIAITENKNQAISTYEQNKNVCMQIQLIRLDSGYLLDKQKIMF